MLYCLRALSLEALRSAFESTRQKSNGEEEEDEEEEDLWRAEIDGVFVPKSFENLSENEIPEGFRMLAGKFGGEKPMSFRVSLAGQFGYAKRMSLEGDMAGDFGGAFGGGGQRACLVGVFGSWVGGGD